MTDPTAFVLFGATGDLAKRMVLPAFYELAQHGLMPERWLLIGNGRGDVSHTDFRSLVRGSLQEFGPDVDDDTWEKFSQNLRFAGGGFDSNDPGSLLDVLEEAKEQLGEDAQYVHYLAIPPTAFEKVTRGLGQHDLAKGSRVVYEKPYGTSPDSFRELDKIVHEVLDEEQVFRIDHFLGKEATQDLHTARFGNTLLSAVWNCKHVAAVQIDAPETLDITDRAQFYDSTGALLDMIVTHLFQLAAEVAMEPPVSMSAEDLQDARETVIDAFRPLHKDEVVLGQFDGYTGTEGVAEGSTTDTFVAARLWVDTDRWHGVPFLLRTGKQLAVSEQRVSLLFRQPDGPMTDVPDQGTVLSFSLAGAGEVDVRLVVKRPGAERALTTAETTLPLSSLPEGDPLPPYVTLLHDVIVGDRALFTTPDGLAGTWTTISPILADRPDVLPYARGSWGPTAADALAEPSGGWVLHG